MVNSINNLFTNNTITQSGLVGFSLTDSTNCTISMNTIDYNYNGLELNGSIINDFLNNSVSNNFFYGYNLDNSSDTNIAYNFLINNTIAISFDSNSDNNTIQRNIISENRGISVISSGTSTNFFFNEFNNNSGIYIFQGNSNHITNNTFNGGFMGISIEGSANNSLINNSMSNSGIFIGYTSKGQVYYQGIIQNNTVNNKPLIFMQNERNKTIPSDVGQIILLNSSMIKIESQSISNTSVGLILYSCTDIQVVNNQFFNSLIGVLVSSSSYSTIENNTISSYYGLEVQFSDHNNITNNSITSLLNVNSTFNGIDLISSTYNFIENNTISLFADGIFLVNSDSNTFRNNSFIFNNEYGISISSSNDNIFSYNFIFNNTLDGMHILSGSGNIITYNMMKLNNRYGLYFDKGADNNEVYLNEFIENSQKPQAYDSGSANSWTNGNYGNYWSDYNGSDANGDGIGDNVYIIAGGKSGDTRPIFNESSYQAIISFLANPHNVDTSNTTIITTGISDTTGLGTTTGLQTTTTQNNEPLVKFIQSTIGLTIVGSILSILMVVTGITIAEYRKYIQQQKRLKSSKTFSEYIKGKFRSKKKQNYDTEEFKENLERIEEIIKENK